MIRESFVLVQNSNHALDIRVYELFLDYLKIPIGAYLVYRVVMKPSPESDERHLVMLPGDDGCDLMTDGFYPLKKLSTRFVTAQGDLVQNGVDGIILFGGSGVLVIRYVLLFFFVLLWCFGCQINLDMEDWYLVVELEVDSFLRSYVEA